jgi:type IV secretory pathway TraG/TraD family ATPase VirD4
VNPRRSHRAWLSAAFVALILLPTAPALALAAAVVAAGVFRGARSMVRRRDAAGSRDDCLVLGIDSRGRTVRVTDDELSAHGLILGASGAGKTTTLVTILSNQIRRGRPVVAIDMKGSPSFARELADAAAGAGRPIKVFTLDGGAHWNPLAHGNATELKDKLMSTERFTEPHYMRAAERYVQTVLQVLARARPDRQPTLAAVVELMDHRRLAIALRDVDRPLRERTQDYVAGLTPDQLSAIRGLQTRLAVLTESHTGAFLAPPTVPVAAIDVREALAGPDVVVFSLNSSKYGKLASQVGTLVVQDLVAASGDRLDAASRGHSLEPALIAIDEFSALGADHVIALLARGREPRTPTLVATQELADLDRAAPGFKDQVLGVTAVKIVHRQDVPDSARTIAQMVGTEEVWEETRQTGGLMFGGFDTGRGTRRLTEKFIIHPNKIKTLRTGEAVVISKIGGSRARTVRVTPTRGQSPRPRPSTSDRPPSADLGR